MAGRVLWPTSVLYSPSARAIMPDTTRIGLMVDLTRAKSNEPADRWGSRKSLPLVPNMRNRNDHFGPRAEFVCPG